MITILGIDPGLQATGWGAIRVKGSQLMFVASGTITSDPKAALCDRLATLYAGLQTVVAEIGPEEAAVESTFVSRDGAATLKLGQARGIALLAPAVRGISVAEYAPNLVKKTVVGAGHADKRQIRHMIGILLPKATPRTEHAADALAVAICHASHRSARTRVAA
ncbi:crossover junction endodeoxyribonuclease RuvC [Acuticoccus sp. I52.16.1]|uniref:crossover junction endodeoxyribonuclease RuvC n=1 Tax=Acuticoccus sp. I52.16.1 TaxID=2928472 RepID=UPI001FD321BB|nr:crossover junction endodeoxyribonuclease RuvC [Acuticoccus sp. I52.16.1]UOM36200.1 crossover junction endodeoxyribonuclease RuvC [Acuticoccus sp. I52.16.1]